MPQTQTLKAPAFLIVGMARSGTSWCQRVITDLNEVGSPPETRFFARYFQDLIKRNDRPLDASAIQDELTRFATYPGVDDLNVNIGRVTDPLDGKCNKPLDLFKAIVQSSSSPAEIHGEKTPRHFRYWLPLSEAMPNLKIIWLVRDPRAVISSVMKTPWGPRLPVEIRTEQWRKSILSLQSASSALGRRLWVVRYEEMIADGEDAFRKKAASFLGVTETTGEQTASVVKKSELRWKPNVTQPADSTRTHAWKHELDQLVAQQIAEQCGLEMERLGYKGGLSAQTYAAGRRTVAWSNEYDLEQQQIELLDFSAEFGQFQLSPDAYRTFA